MVKSSSSVDADNPICATVAILPLSISAVLTSTKSAISGTYPNVKNQLITNGNTVIFSSLFPQKQCHRSPYRSNDVNKYRSTQTQYKLNKCRFYSKQPLHLLIKCFRSYLYCFNIFIFFHQSNALVYNSIHFCLLCIYKTLCYFNIPHSILIIN